MQYFSGLHNHMGNLCSLSDAKTRSISAENPTGEKGGGAKLAPPEGISAHAARDLGRGWKVNPCVKIEAGETLCIADIEGPGAIQHIWFTPTGNWRDTILRMYWDDQPNPSVECPVGDFFGMGWGKYAQISSLAVCVNPGSAFNCYWTMPFRKRCRITVENIDEQPMTLYYQITYALCDVGEREGYFHAQFRRSNPLPYKQTHLLLDGVQGKGQYVGTYIAWGSNNNRWWGEGEIKFYLDGDQEFPTICGTGTEDYFCGSYDFRDFEKGGYLTYTTPFAGFHQCIRPDGHFESQTRFGLYRWHITDPIRFEQDIRVDIQALGWGNNGRHLPLQDDIASVAFWYQALPTAPFPALPAREYLEVI